MISEEKRSTMKGEMRTDEKLLWCGEPDPKRVALPTFFIWLFGIPWTAFAVFWMATAYGMGHPNNPNVQVSGGMPAVFPLFGLPFLLIGIAILSSPFAAYNRAKKTIYGISDRRAIIITGSKTRKIDSYDHSSMGQINRIERADNSGDLLFAQRFSGSSNGNQTATNIGFFGVPDVRKVEQLMLDVFSQDPSHDAAGPRTPLR